jgi:hypothetical protein
LKRGETLDGGRIPYKDAADIAIANNQNCMPARTENAADLGKHTSHVSNIPRKHVAVCRRQLPAPNAS